MDHYGKETIKEVTLKIKTEYQEKEDNLISTSPDYTKDLELIHIALCKKIQQNEPIKIKSVIMSSLLLLIVYLSLVH